MVDKEKWEKKALSFVEQTNVLNVKQLKEPAPIWCKPEGATEPHQVNVSKIYIQNTGRDNDLVFVLCPEHNTAIRIKMVDDNKA